jgi:DNA-binding CsgD family transcriptional regulator
MVINPFSEHHAMADIPSIDQVLKRALARVDDQDVRLFYAYFDELKEHVRRYLRGRGRLYPGESHVAQSALVSMFCDLAVQDIPLQEVDEYGYPMLWPLLLKYLDRHCEKWKKYHRAKKRSGGQVALGELPGFEPADRRGQSDEEAVAAALTALYEKLTPRQRLVADLSAQGRTLEEIAQELGCSDSLVSIEKKAIRRLLESD